MNRYIRNLVSIMLSIVIMTAFMPAETAWSVSDASNESVTEAAEDHAASIGSDENEDPEEVPEDQGETVSEDGQSEEKEDSEESIEEDNEEAADKDENDDTVNDPDASVDNMPDEIGPAEVSAAGADEAGITVDDAIGHGSVVLTETEDGYSGTATPDDGYDLASIRQIWTDAENAEHEQYLEYTEEADGSYSFTVTAVDDPSVVTAYFYDLDKWDGAVDLTWYDPDESEYEISTPAQLAGLAAVTNGMVDDDVTEEYMIKDPEGRSYSDGKYSHQYVSTEPAEADLLTPNHAEGAGQVRDIVWRLPEVEHRKLGEDDIHNDFLYRTVRLTADLDMGDKNWTPIGGKYSMNNDAKGDEDSKVVDTRFQGVFDGQGHTVTINCDRYAPKGFAYAMEIALVGYLGGGVDYANGYPKDTYMDYAEYWVPTVRNVVVRGKVIGRRMVAGVVGRTGETNYGVLVENCANYADVYASDMRGCAGIVGAAWGKTMIRNCYNAGTIRSEFNERGGIIGSNGYEGTGTREPAGADIYNCYNIGKTGINKGDDNDPEYDGQEIGVDGNAFAGYTVSNCYYLEPEEPIADKTGYSTGTSNKNSRARVTDSVRSADIRSPEILELLNANGRVFEEDTGNINNGYPVLYFQNASSQASATVTLVQTDGGTVSSHSDLTEVPYGTTIDLAANADEGKRLTGYKVTSEQGSIMIPSNGFFTVTGDDVTIEGVFGDSGSSVLSFIDENSGADYYVKVEKIHDNGDHTELHSGDAVYGGDIITITTVPKNITEVQPDIKDLEYTGKFFDPAYTPGSLTIKSTAGTKKYEVTGLTDVVDITVKPKTQGKRWTTVADTGWYSEDMDSFTISSAKELAGVAKLCNSGESFEGKTIILGSDISLENTPENSGDEYGSERNWIGIGNVNNPFKGTFDGKGHTVKCMHRNFADGYCPGDNGGLFGVTDGAVIRNVTVEGGTYINSEGVSDSCGFENGATGGSIAGEANNTVIENCKGSVPMYKASEAGGIAGSLEGSSRIVNCSSDSVINGANGRIGGIAGTVTDDGPVIEGCVFSGSIDSEGSRIGGILGTGEYYGAEIVRCVNNADITVTMKSASSNMFAAGGIIGYAAGPVICRQSVNTGSIKGYQKAFSLGGIAGTVTKGTIEDCYNTGSVYSESSAEKAATSGIANADTNRFNSAVIRNCYNAGSVTVSSGYKGKAAGAVAEGNTTKNVFEKIYCTTTSASSIGGSAGIAGKTVKDAELKALNVTLGDAFAVDKNNINGGFPVLAWQDPAAVATVKAISIKRSGSDSLTVTWTAAGPRDGFELQRSVNGGAWSAVYNGNAASYTNKGLAAGSKYSYRVRAFRVSGGTSSFSDWSKAVSVELLPPAMKISSVKNPKKGTAVIKWKRMKGAAGYVIYRSTSKKGKYKKAATVKVTKKNKSKKTLSFTNKKLKKKKTYYYKIVYYKKISGKTVYSEMSAPKSVKIKK